MSVTKPNFVFIITDQQRWDHVGCNGNAQIKTPHLDQLAAAGISLDRHYCNHPLCTPSRASLITGRYPRSNRVYDNGCSLSTNEVTLPQVLSGAGYDTRAVGKLHLSSWLEPNAQSLESQSFWASGKGPEEPVPYAGFDAVEICTRHINPHTGHYGVWLRKEHSEVVDDWDSYLTPHSSEAPQTFDWALPPELHANAWVADRSCSYIRQQANGDRPFFLHVGFPDPHHPFRAPDPWGTMYNPAAIDLREQDQGSHDSRPPEYAAYMRGDLNSAVLGVGDFNTSDLRSLTREQLQVIHAKTYGMVSFVDEQVGRIVETLRETGQLDNTYIIFTSDHGDLMGDFGLILKAPFLLEGLVKVPMIVAGPGIRAGQRSSDLTAHIDLMPTFLAAAGVSPPQGLEGGSFLPLLDGTGSSGRQRVLIECLHQFQFDRNVKSIVTDDAKLICWGGQSYGELYDLANDPRESCNLWDEPSWQRRKNQLLEHLLHELLKTENVLPLPTAAT